MGWTILVFGSMKFWKFDLQELDIVGVLISRPIETHFVLVVRGKFWPQLRGAPKFSVPIVTRGYGF